ncbi:MAG TPA: cyclic nucleotide-binding domain-containing protein [Thermoanaerobaculia bacterium]|nr:cyclic nucleotide-binding domain-containing protein [Thermoanaerobaculia bacterium]
MMELSLKEVSVFEGVDEERLRELEGRLETKSFDANDLIFRKDDRCDGVYVVARGGVTIRNEVAGEPVERVRELGRGDLFGEIEVLEGARRHFSARTVEPTTLYKIPQESLLDFLRSHPPVEARLRSLAIHRRTSRLRTLLSPQTRRKEPRIWIDRHVVLTLENGERIEAHLENLSAGGACLRGIPPDWCPVEAVRFSLGIEKRLDLLRADGVVRWRQGDTVGIAFDGIGTGQRRRVEQAIRDLVGTSH